MVFACSMRTTAPLRCSSAVPGRYGTVIEDEGIAYLHLKTVERAHTPKNLCALENGMRERHFA